MSMFPPPISTSVPMYSPPSSRPPSRPPSLSALDFPFSPVGSLGSTPSTPLSKPMTPGSFTSPRNFSLGITSNGSDFGDNLEVPCTSPIIFINGFPGVGKLTIANALSKVLPSSKVLDNHLLINAAVAVYDRADPSYQPLRKALRATVFDSIITSPTHQSTTWIFVDSQSTSALGTSVSHEYLSASRKRRCPFISIILSCSKRENLKRVSAHGRKERSKLTNREVLKELREGNKIHRFEDWIGVREYEVDVTELSAEEAASVVKRRVEEALSTLSSHDNDDRSSADI